jgi:hypothetical protein
MSRANCLAVASTVSAADSPAARDHVQYERTILHLAPDFMLIEYGVAARKAKLADLGAETAPGPPTHLSVPEQLCEFCEGIYLTKPFPSRLKKSRGGTL